MADFLKQNKIPSDPCDRLDDVVGRLVSVVPALNLVSLDRLHRLFRRDLGVAFQMGTPTKFQS